MTEGRLPSVMRTPGSLGDLLPVAVPGFLVVGALSVLLLPTALGALAFGGPAVQLVVGLLTGALVFGYLIAGLQEALARRAGRWALPPSAHFAAGPAVVELPATAVERAGYAPASPGPVSVPLGLAYSLERSLAGEWGTPEGAGWDRVAFLHRVSLALGLAAVLAAALMLGTAAAGAFTSGIRSHASAVLLLGGLASWMVGRFALQARREAVLDLLADARALLMDRGDTAEVRHALAAIGLELAEESPRARISP